MAEDQDKLFKEIVAEKQSEKKHPVITKITTQRRKGRYNIYLDDQYAFSVDEALLVKYYLRKGMEISPEMKKKLEKEDQTKKAYQRALAYLSYALRSKKEVQEDLVAHEFEEEVEAVIQMLSEQGMINDSEYARSYVRTASNLNRKGPKVIERDLVQKGISQEDIANAMDEYSEELQVENGVKLGKKIIKKSARRSTRQTTQKIQEHLMQKGYTSDIISQVLPLLEPEKDEEEEMDALRVQGEKAWRRYKKFEKYERIQKTKSNLR